MGALVMLAPLALVKGSVLEQAGMGRSAWGLTSSSCFADPEHGGGAGSHLQPGEIPHYQRGTGGEHFWPEH